MVHILTLQDLPFHKPDRFSRRNCKPPCSSGYDISQFSRGRRARNHTKRLSLRTQHGFAKNQKLHGSGQAERAGLEPRTSSHRVHTAIDHTLVLQTSVFSRKSDITSHSLVQAHAQGKPVNLSNHGFRQCAQRLLESCMAQHPFGCICIAFRQITHATKFITRTEAFALSKDDYDTNSRVIAAVFECIDKLRQHDGGDGVAPFRPIQRKGCNTGANFKL